MGAESAIVAAYKSNSDFDLNELIIAFAIAVAILLALFYFYRKRKRVIPVIPSAYDLGWD